MSPKDVDYDWIKAKMKELNIKQKDLAEDFEVSKGWVSDVLNPKGRSSTLTRFQQAAFYYYFKYKEDQYNF